MRTKTIIDGFKNSQKFRFILMANSGEEFGMTISIQQMSDQFATSAARAAVWDALQKLAVLRSTAKRAGNQAPSGLVTGTQDFRQVQVDLA